VKHRKPAKRDPLLVDQFLASSDMVRFGPYLERGFIEKVRSGLYQAKRFLLDEEATIYLAKAIASAPEVIAMAREFAIPPFPIMYIEMPDFAKWYRTVNGIEPMPGADTKVGYLFIGPNAYCLGLTGKPEGEEDSPKWVNGGMAVAVPIEYRFNQPFRPGEAAKQAKEMGLEEEDLPILFWGSSWERVKGTQWENALWEDMSVHMAVNSVGMNMMDLETRRIFASSNAGDLRNMIAMLLFLNRTSQCTYVNEVPMAPGHMLRNKPRTLLSHSVVTLDVAKAPSVRTMFLGSTGGSWKREHDVRGHFCVGKTARESNLCNGLHDWHEYNVNQWKCSRCGGLKWWRKDCRRGTKNKGKVHTTYEVTAKAVHSSAQQEQA
jgi:hypothetical protein